MTIAREHVAGAEGKIAVTRHHGNASVTGGEPNPDLALDPFRRSLGDRSGARSRAGSRVTV